LNSFNIKQGDKVGQPGYGTTIWNYLFEPNTSDVRQSIEEEIRRVASLDPRLTINTLELYYQDHGILVEIEISVNPYQETVQFGFFLNRFNGTIQQLSQ
jgi:phage baseplate assembly protein W